MNKRNLFIDAEWYISQRIFLIGCAFTEDECFQFYGKKLTLKNFRKLLKKVSGYVFCYGPDIGMTEKFFKWKYRNQYKCVNLMKVFRNFIKTGSFKLKDLELRFGIRRKVSKYKTTIFHIWRDWRNPKMREAVLKYNREDVINLIRITRRVFTRFNVKPSYLNTITLK